MKLLKLYPSSPHLPLLIYCPGMDGTGRLLHKQATTLRPFFNICCLSYPFETEETWNSLAKKAINLVEKEVKRLSKIARVPSAIYLLGESFGGCLTLKMVTQKPSLFDKVILVNSASAFRLRPWLSIGGLITRWLPDNIHQGSCLGLLPFLAALGRLENCDRQALLQAMRSLPPLAVSWRISLLNEFDINKITLSKLSLPFLILASGCDRLLPSLEEARNLGQLLPNKIIKILPNSGHACLLETELNLIDILQESNFLDPLFVC
ncbi:MAG: alpha/beta fold hydrolase [Microcystaceae cyanobacterium]